MLQDVDAGVDRGTYRVGVIKVSMNLDACLVRLLDHGTVVLLGQSHPGLDDI